MIEHDDEGPSFTPPYFLLREYEPMSGRSFGFLNGRPPVRAGVRVRVRRRLREYAEWWSLRP